MKITKNELKQIIKETVSEVLSEGFVEIGELKQSFEGRDLYYDKNKKQFMIPNNWDGTPTILQPNKIKWNKYNLTSLGKKLYKQHMNESLSESIKVGDKLKMKDVFGEDQEGIVTKLGVTDVTLDFKQLGKKGMNITLPKNRIIKENLTETTVKVPSSLIVKNANQVKGKSDDELNKIAKAQLLFIIQQNDNIIFSNDIINPHTGEIYIKKGESKKDTKGNDYFKKELKEYK